MPGVLMGWSNSKRMVLSWSHLLNTQANLGAQWLSGRVLDSRPRGRGFEPHWRHCIMSFSKNIFPSLVLVQPRKTRPFITERLLMGHKESNKNIKKHKQIRRVFTIIFKQAIQRFYCCVLCHKCLKIASLHSDIMSASCMLGLLREVDAYSHQQPLSMQANQFYCFDNSRTLG